MPAPQGLAFWPGVGGVISADIARGHGISPQPMTLTITPQRTPPRRQGTLTLRYGSFQRSVPGCIIDQAQYRFDRGGYLVGLTILDRRWKWQYLKDKNSAVSGRFNVRLPHGPVDRMDPDTVKSLSEIVALCLEKLGEKNAVVQKVPNLFPELYWDRKNPAQALQEACDIGGLRVILRWDNRVLVTPPGMSANGTPATLPNGPVIYDNFGVNPPERPDEIHLICGPTRFQGDFMCEAVGDDVDALVVPIRELTYRPPGGWENGDILEFLDVPLYQGSVDNWFNFVRPRELAKASVYLKYRVTLKGPLRVPGYKDEAKLKANKDTRQILPIGQELIEPTFDKETGWFKPVETIVWGVFAYDTLNNDEEASIDDGVPNDKQPKPRIIYPERDRVTGDELPSKATSVVSPEDYELDQDTGIVTFRRQMWRYGADQKSRYPAIIWIRCGVCINDKETKVPVRHREVYKFPGPKLGGGILEIFDDTLFVRYTPTYSGGRPDSITGATDNIKKVKETAKSILGAEARKFQDLEPKLRTYACWDRYDLDGGVQQVAYHLGTDGVATMTVCLNNELTILTMPYNERRFYEKWADEQLNLGSLLKMIRENNLPWSRLSNLTRRGR